MERAVGVKRLALVGLVLFVGLGLAPLGCGDDDEEVTPDAGVQDTGGTETITVAAPMSQTGRYAETGAQIIAGVEAAINWVNDTHGGVSVSGQSLDVEFVYYDDESEAETVEGVVQQLCDDDTVDFILGPYSSGLSAAAAPISEACGKLLVVTGGASNTIFESGYENVVQILSPGEDYHRGFLDLIDNQVDDPSALDLALAYEEGSFTASVAAGALAHATSLGFNVVFDETYPAGAEDGDLGSFVSDLAAAEPDIIIGGGHTVDTRALTRVLAAEGVTPLAMSLLVGPATADFPEQVCPAPCSYLIHPAEGVSVPAQWEPGVTYSQSRAEAAGQTWFGPSQEQFLTLFETVAGADSTPDYQAAQGAAAILALTLAIEQAGSLETGAVRDAFDSLEFVSFYGGFDVDETGLQVGHDMVELQWQGGSKVIVWPEDASTGDFVYPIPTPIRVAAPMSLTGRYAETGAQIISGVEALTSWVNETHGGVEVGGQSRPIEFVYYDDESDTETVETVVGQLCDDESVDFILGPYSSGSNLAAAAVSEACGKLLLVNGGASNEIFDNEYENVVQILSPGDTYHRGFLDLIDDQVDGPLSDLDIALAYEEGSFTASVAAGALAHATELGFNVVFNDTYVAGAEEADLTTFVADLKSADPDIIVGGGHAADTRALTRVLADQGVEPLAMSLLVGPAAPDFYEQVEACPDPCDYDAHPAEGVAAPAQWELGVTYSQTRAEAQGKTWFGPSQEEFLTLFHGVAGADVEPGYQAAQGGATILTLVLAIEAADSVETAAVRDALDDLEFTSFYGDFDVDETGLQVGHDMVELQWQDGQKVIVWPEAASTGECVYPMP